MSSTTGIRFVETLEHRRFQEFCEACRRDRYIGLCYGPPGVGKTISALEYSQWEKMRVYQANVRSQNLPETQFRKLLADVQNCVAVFYTPPVVNTPKNIQRDIDRLRSVLMEPRKEKIRRNADAGLNRAQRKVYKLRERTVPGSLSYVPARSDLSNEEEAELTKAEQAYQRLHDRMMQRQYTMTDPTQLILVDEADRLKESGLEQVRDMFDRSTVGLVLIGMPGIEKRLARYPQLYSRVGFVHEFRPLSPKEVRRLLEERQLPSMLDGAGLNDEEVISAILRVTGGNFRLLDRLLTQMVRILEINQLKRVTREVVEAARESLVIGTA